MKTYIALFRGINVGGNHLLPMKDLRQLFETHGCLDVRTYIQSGNVIFRSAMSDVSQLAQQVTATVSSSHGFEPRVLVLTRSQFERAAAGNPFADAEQNPTSLHLFFLAEHPTQPDLTSMQALRTKTERLALKGRILYLHTPDGFGTSKLAQRVERLVGVEATARNWRTVRTILDMANVSG